MGRIVKTAVVTLLAGTALTVGSPAAQADKWDPWIPGIPDLGGPGVNVWIPGNPLPPGQVKNFIEDLIPNFGGKGKWK